MKLLEDLSCFSWMTHSESLNYDDIEPYIQFLTNMGVATDIVKYFDQLSHLKNSQKVS